jgi:hypothetical protein
MEHLIRDFGSWLKQGFGWLVDVIVFGCLWGISQVSRLLGTHFGGASLVKIVVFVLVLLLLLYAFYFVFVRFIGVIRWALDRIAYALGGVGSVRKCRTRFGFSNLGDEQHQLGIAVSSGFAMTPRTSGCSSGCRRHRPTFSSPRFVLAPYGIRSGR